MTGPAPLLIGRRAAERRRRVAELRRLVASGEYRVEAADVADAILRSTRARQRGD